MNGNIQEQNYIAWDIIGLALALLCGECFIKLIDFYEDESTPVEGIKQCHSFPVKEFVSQSVKKRMALGGIMDDF